MKIAFFETGRAHDIVINEFDKHDNKVYRISWHKVKLINYSLYDIIVIPSYYNQDILSEISNKLKQYIQDSGILVLFGVMEDKTKWLPYCTTDLNFIKDIEFLNREDRDAMLIFKDLNPVTDDFKYHDAFIAHGSITCDANICREYIAVKNSNSKIIFGVIEPEQVSGKLIISTLDPEYHAIVGQTKTGVLKNEKARQLFINTMTLAIVKARNVNKINKYWRIIKGITAYTVSKYLLYLLFITLLIFVLLGFVGIVDKQLFSYISSFITILSFMLYIVNVASQ